MSDDRTSTNHANRGVGVVGSLGPVPGTNHRPSHAQIFFHRFEFSGRSFQPTACWRCALAANTRQERQFSATPGVGQKSGALRIGTGG